MKRQAPGGRGLPRGTVPLLGSYQLALLVPLGIFTWLLVGGGQLPAGAIAGLWVGTWAGTYLGQLTGVLRLRSWLAVPVLALPLLFLPSLDDAHAFGHTALILTPLFGLTGRWSTHPRTALIATFGPLLWLMSSVLLLAERQGLLFHWHLGDRWSVWSVGTASILGLGVAMLLVFLVHAETRGLHRWLNGNRTPPNGPSPPPLGLGGLGALIAWGVGLTMASAGVAPYLWHSAPRDGDIGTAADRGPERTLAQPRFSGGGSAEPSQPLVLWHDWVQDAATQAAGSIILWGLMILLLVGMIWFLVPPLERALRIRHMRRPLWPVNPTRRVQLHWGLVEQVLADAGVPKRPDESPTMLVERALAERNIWDPEDLRACAQRVERVLYGLGMDPEDPVHIRRSAEMAYQTVWEDLSEPQKLQAAYRA